MSKVWMCPLGLIAALAPARADWKITTATTDSRGRQSVRTEYYKNRLRRTDFEENGSPRLIAVVDLEAARQTAWDPKRKEYTTTSLKYIPRGAVMPEGDPATRPVLFIAATTTDTGERKTLFGRTARHLITSEKRSREDRGNAEAKSESETVTDGWYVDASGLPADKRGESTAMLVGSSNQIPIVKATHMGPVASGVAVRQKVTSRLAGVSDMRFYTEVTDLHEGALSLDVFEPPADFKRVAKLANTSFFPQPTLSDEIQMYWNSLENWFLSWFS